MLMPSSDWITQNSHGSPQVLPPRTLGPCDIYSAAGIPCVAAHSVVRALYANYTGPLYRVSRSSDMASLNIDTHHGSGLANALAQDAFCNGTECHILRLFDQSPQGNHLDVARAGGACNHTLRHVDATMDPMTGGGSNVYGA